MDGDCAICLEPLNNNSSIVNCRGRHKFHKSCIRGWRGQGKDTCPVCRGDIGYNNNNNTNIAPPPPPPPPIGWPRRDGYTNGPPENRPRMRRGSPRRRIRQRANITPSPSASPSASPSPKGCVGRFCKFLGIRAGSKKKNLKKKKKKSKKRSKNQKKSKKN
jgi:hypothetical protein